MGEGVREDPLLHGEIMAIAPDVPADELVEELCAILASGFLRMKRRKTGVDATQEASADSAEESGELAGCSVQAAAPCAHRLAARENESAGEET